MRRSPAEVAGGYPDGRRRVNRKPAGYTEGMGFGALRLGFAVLWLGAAGWLAYRVYLDPNPPPVRSPEVVLVLMLVFAVWNLARWQSTKGSGGVQPRRPRPQPGEKEYHPEFDFTKPDEKR
jgi:hypothetical protein